MPPNVGAHRFPLLKMNIAEFARDKVKQDSRFCRHRRRVVGQKMHRGAADALDRRHHQQAADGRGELDGAGPAVASVRAADASGTHSNENMTRSTQTRLVLAHFNAGVRALDIRDPYHQVAYYIPAVNAYTEPRCLRSTALIGADLINSQQRRSRRPRIHLCRRSRQYGAASCR
jgi:hypothetical protein